MKTPRLVFVVAALLALTAASAGLFAAPATPIAPASKPASKPAPPSAPATAAAPAVESPWQTRLPAFSDAYPARGENPILLYFTAGWCGFCKKMETTTLADKTVRARVARLRAHKLDFDTQGGLVKRFAVRGIPAFILTNDRGELIDRFTGAGDASAFLAWLTAAEAKSVRLAQSSVERAAALRALPGEALSPEAPTRLRALDALWILAARGDATERPAALEAIGRLTGASPFAGDSAPAEAWRVGLAHADLAVRVAAANLLRQQGDEKRTFDPWADEAERTRALARLGF